MTKSTMGTKLPCKLEQKMQIVGEQIRLARLRRNLSVAKREMSLFEGVFNSRISCIF